MLAGGCCLAGVSSSGSRLSGASLGVRKDCDPGSRAGDGCGPLSPEEGGDDSGGTTAIEMPSRKDISESSEEDVKGDCD